MLDYLNIRHYDNKQRLNLRDFINFKSAMIRFYTENKKDYREMKPFIRSDHVLSQLLSHLNIFGNEDIFTLYQRVMEQGRIKGQMLNMSSYANYGQPFIDGIYGKDFEVIILDTLADDPIRLSENWRELKPLKVLRHSYNNFDFQAILGSEKYTGNINVLILNVVELAIQYQKFLEEEHDGRIRDRDWFLIQYPLMGLLESHLDVALINKYLYKPKLEKEVKILTAYSNKPVDFFDNFIRDYRITINKGKYNYLEMATFTPLVFNDNLLSYLNLEDFIINRNNHWGLIYAYLPVLDYIYQAGREGINTEFRAGIQYLIRRTNADDPFANIRNSYLRKSFQAEFELFKMRFIPD